MNTASSSRLVRHLRRSLLVAGAFALGPASHAQVDVFTNSPPGFPGTGFPYWDTANPGVWSLGAVPTAFQDALFPANPDVPPAALLAVVGLRPDATEVIISNLVPGNPNPIANNLIFLGNYRLNAVTTAPFGVVPAAFLTLNAGHVTVVRNKMVILDTDVSVLSGQLTKLGDGTLIIGTGRTIRSNVLVTEGTFGGTGLVSGDLINQANVAPGNSPGTLHVGGTFKQTKSGRLQVEIASAENFDRLDIGDKAKLNGRLDVTLLNGFRPKKGEKFTFLTAKGGVSGTFARVDAPVWNLLTLRPFYDKARVYLKTVINSFEALPGLTPNQHAVAHSLDGAIYDERSEKLISHLYNRDLNKLPGDFDRIAPEELTSIFTISTSLAQVQSINVQRRTDDLRNGASGFSAAGLAMNGTGPSYSGPVEFRTGPSSSGPVQFRTAAGSAGPVAFRTGVAGPTGDFVRDGKESKEVAPPEARWGVFLAGTGEWVDVSGDGNARGYNLTTGGFTLGFDYKLGPNFALGVLVGYTGTGVDLTDGGSVLVNGGKFGIYATTFGGGWYADVAATGGLNGYDTRRSALQGIARGSTNGGELNVLFGTGYDWKIGALTIGPTATFNYTLVGIDGYTERGSLAPLNIASRNAESVRSAFGFKASYDWKVGGMLFKPELRAAWQHEYGDSSYALDATFANGAGSSFLVNGPEIGRDSLLLGAGCALQLTERTAAYVYYDGELGRTRFVRNAINGGVRVAF